MSSNYIGLRYTNPKRLIDNPILSSLEADIVKEDVTANVKYWGAKEDGVTDDTAAINAAAATLQPIFFSANALVRVPEDYPTLQQAVDNVYVYTSGVVITIRISTGHAPTSGVTIVDKDCRHLRITAVDALVTVAASWPNNDSFIKGTRSVLPALGCRVDMNGRGSSGYYVDVCSTGYVEENMGVDNSGGLGADLSGHGLLVISGSTCSAAYCIFNGHKRNLWVSQASQCYADHGTFDNGTDDFAVYIARSSIATLSYASISNNFGIGIKVRRAWATSMVSTITNNGGAGVSATDCSTIVLSQALTGFGSTITGNGSNGINCFNSRCYAPDSVITGNTGESVSCADSIIDISNCNLSGTGATSRGLDQERGEVNAKNTTVDNTAASAFRVLNGILNCENATVTNTPIGIDAYYASRVDARGCSITGAGNIGIRATDVTTINADASTITGSVTTDAAVLIGSVINLNGATTTSGAAVPADTNVAAFNAIDSNNGIIWA